MKGANYRVVLDACVLANHGICDLFLRLATWKIHAVHPADYLITLYSIAPDVVVAKLGDMARATNQEPRFYLEKLGRSVPAFATHVAESLGWSLDDPGAGLQS